LNLEKKALGKGLGALIPGAAREEPVVSSPTEVPLDRISANPYQPRKTFDDEKFQDLVKSVRVHGVLQPVVVRSKGEGAYELVAGERRMRAAMAAGLTQIPAVIRELTNEQSLEVALIENLQREYIAPPEAAIAYKRLMDEFGLTQDEVAFRVGKSRSTVANTLRLLNLPQEFQESLSKGEITEGHARALLAIPDPDTQHAAWQETIHNGLSVRQLEGWNKNSAPAKRAGVSRETLVDPNLLSLQEQLQRLFGTKVSIVKSKEQGRIEIHFYSDDELERILSLLGG
jgi:ParB family chromosome partitioning protein